MRQHSWAQAAREAVTYSSDYEYTTYSVTAEAKRYIRRIGIILTILILGFCVTADAQISMVSRTYSVSEFSQSQKKYVEKKSGTGNTYITLNKSEVTMICPHCSGDMKKIVLALGKKGDAVDTGNDVIVLPYEAYVVSSGEKISIKFFFRFGKLVSVSLSDSSSSLIIYDGLEEY